MSININKMQDLSDKEQYAIIEDVENNFAKFWDKDFDYSTFLKCKDNFAKTKQIKSVQIMQQKKLSSDDEINFSIAIPNYKRIDELKEAIKSAMGQNFDEKYEILVVENTDDFDDDTVCEAIKKDFLDEINYYKNEKNLGAFGNWDRCLSLAKGKWVCLLHSDDQITSDYLNKMREMLQNEDVVNAILIGCVTDIRNVYPPIKQSKMKAKIKYFFQKIFYSKERIFQKSISNLQWRKEALSDEMIFVPPNAILHNKDKCLKLGGYNDEEYPNADQIFVNRMKQFGTIFTYRKSILQFKNSAVSFGLTPRCIVQLCYMDTAAFQAFIKSKKRAMRASFKQIRGYKKFLENKKCFILAKYLQEIVFRKFNKKLP